ncbi:HAD hydrolase-like protein [Pararhodospirillum photometricum]|uniref:HAD-superfamily hydrolase, subfamily IIA n=1 Tax=Pararhodospirillum photometricum DSM 122 TaxID=1150469 RepID=H6SPK9_PARPM|nr:HAD hydrolase-like protein [Pararhodospirillum photometricum]CCG09534.1 HAD-superfamily hydrolase, subfamily IIA [Pararhodospirillum photometricum DSM 122]
MLFVSFEAAWAVYTAARPFLPPFPAPPAASQRVSGLAEVLDQGDVDLVVLDAYGVLHEGNGAFPWALDAVADLRARGLPFCVVTNDVTHPPEDVAARLAALGFPVGAEAVVSGRSLLPAALPNAGQGFAVLGSHPDAVVARCPGSRPGTDAPADLDDAAGFVLVDTNDWEDDGPARRLAESLERRPRPLVVCNPDVTCPFRGRLSLEPGFFAFPLAARLPAGYVRFVGKPWPGVYGLVRQRFPAASPARILAVGDSPHTDVLGARSQGMRALLVGDGLLRGGDALERAIEVGLAPEYEAGRI